GGNTRLVLGQVGGLASTLPTIIAASRPPRAVENATQSRTDWENGPFRCARAGLRGGGPGARRASERATDLRPNPSTALCLADSRGDAAALADSPGLHAPPLVGNPSTVRPFSALTETDCVARVIGLKLRNACTSQVRAV